MDVLNILGYGGISLLCLLLIIFEIKDRSFAVSRSVDMGYEYYTCGNVVVRIQHLFANRYKVYISDASSCPIPTKQDRYGAYFNLKAGSASEAESKIDELYRNI